MTKFGDYEVKSFPLITNQSSTSGLLHPTPPEASQRKPSVTATRMDTETDIPGQEMIVFDNKMDPSISTTMASDIARDVRQCYPPNNLRPLRGQDAPVSLSPEAKAHPLFSDEFFEVLKAPHPFSHPIRFVPDEAL